MGRTMNGAQSRLEKTLVELNCQCTPPTADPSPPLHRRLSTPKLKGQRNFLSKVAAQATLPKQVPTKSLSLETIGSLIEQSPLSAKGLLPNRMKLYKGVGSWAVLDLGPQLPSSWRTCSNFHPNSDLPGGYWKRAPKCDISQRPFW